MNHVDTDKKVCRKDAYGNLIPNKRAMDARSRSNAKWLVKGK